MKKYILYNMITLAVLYIVGSMNMEGRQADIYGKWHIDRAVLKSEMYTGTVLDGDYEENLYNPEDYIGLELEYASDFFRIGDQVYKNPRYILSRITVYDWQRGSKFCLPDLYRYIEENGIEIKGYEDSETWEELRRFDIDFGEDVRYWDEKNNKEYKFVPVGTHCVLLNDDTMLLGIWGKILEATRVEDDRGKEYAVETENP